MQTRSTVIPPTIVVAQSTVYASQGGICALDARTGTISGRYEFHGIASPAVMNGVLYINENHKSEHTIQALRASDGISLWRYKTEGRLSYSPSVVAGVVYATTAEGEVYALQASDGALLWRYETGPILFAPPTVVDGVVYVSPAVNHPAQPFVYALQASNGSLLWRSAIPDSTTLPLMVADGAVYIGTHKGYFVLRASDGSPLWSYELQSSLLSSHVVLAGKVYIGFSRFAHEFMRQSRQLEHRQYGCIHALDADDGSPLWQQEIGAEVNTGGQVLLAAVDTVIYARTPDGSLAAIQASDGTLLWRYQSDGALLSSSVAADGIVYVGASDGYVYALQADNGSLLWRTFVGNSVTAVSAIRIRSMSLEKPE